MTEKDFVQTPREITKILLNFEDYEGDVTIKFVKDEPKDKIKEGGHNERSY